MPTWAQPGSYFGARRLGSACLSGASRGHRWGSSSRVGSPTVLPPIPNLRPSADGALETVWQKALAEQAAAVGSGGGTASSCAGRIRTIESAAGRPLIEGNPPPNTQTNRTVKCGTHRRTAVPHCGHALARARWPIVCAVRSPKCARRALWHASRLGYNATYHTPHGIERTT